VPVGEHSLRYEFTSTERGFGPPGHSLLYIDDQLVGAANLPRTTPNRMGLVGFSCGYAAFDSVDPDRYTIPFRFTGTIHRVIFDVSGDLLQHNEAEMQRMMTQQ
jgi:hypothetical protein